MKNIYTILLPLLILAASCVKETVPECPPQYTISLFVKDKNYFNVSTSPGAQPVDENLAFRQYVSNLYYTLYNVTTNTLYQTQKITITNDDKEQLLLLDDVPSGEYMLTVWGNIDDSGIVNDSLFALHPLHQESTDLYVVSKLLTFNTTWQATSLGMERTKGKLQVICNNLPDSITNVSFDIASLFAEVSVLLNYTGQINMEAGSTLPQLPANVVEVLLAPTVYGTNSALNATLFVKGNQPLFTSTDIAINIKRNEIYTLSIDFNAIEHAWEIWLFIDAKWTRVYYLSLSTN